VLQPERSIAWGQAMFLGGGNVMPVYYGTLGLAYMGRGLATVGLPFGLVMIRRKLWLRREGIDQV